MAAPKVHCGMVRSLRSVEERMAAAGDTVPVPEVMLVPVVCRLLEMTPHEIAQTDADDLHCCWGAADGFAAAQWVREQDDRTP